MDHEDITAIRTNRQTPSWALVLLGWFVLSLIASLAGLFDRPGEPPVPIGAAVILPLLIFAGLYFASAQFRQFAQGLSLRAITAAQTWRLAGIVFVILYHQGILPALFALPAGYGDMLIGATAPLVVWAMNRPGGLSRQILVAWHILGMLDLLMAVTLGVLSSAGPAGILAKSVTTAPMGQFPLSLIPTFFVPLLLILHLIAITQATRSNLPRK